jgi:cation diffusion facilitator CzcD-associated flavoprotein CzcO
MLYDCIMSHVVDAPNASHPAPPSPREEAPILFPVALRSRNGEPHAMPGAPADEGDQAHTRGLSGRRSDFKVVIIGTGFAGLGMAIQLKKAGIDDFVLLERASALGGTWRDNRYPGCACDVPSHLYSFSFEPKADWSRAYSPQEEIRLYLEHCADKYGLREHIRFDQDVTSAIWQEDAQVWEVRSTSGTVRGNMLVSGIGALSNPSYPNVPGRERFRGKQFHSATWDHDHPLEGKRVGVIGTGASAIQFVPVIQPKVSHLTLFQRTPPWILPKPDRAYAAWEKALFSKVPGVRFLLRQSIYWSHEARVLVFSKAPKLMKAAADMGRKHIARNIRNEELRRKVTPDYLPGCKRILISNDYYASLDRPNVEVTTDGVREIVEDGVVLASGRHVPLDTLIYGTGFTVQSYLGKLRIYGRGGHELSERWGKNPAAYRGTTVAGYPNLFTLLGPNTGLGHNSVVFMIEAQIRYVMKCIDHMKRAKLSSVDVLPEVQASYNKALGRELDTTVWASGCESWYLNDEGKNTTIYPGFTFFFRQALGRFHPEEYAVTRGVPAFV